MVVITSGAFFQVNKSNKALEYKQQQEQQEQNAKLLLEAQENDKKEKIYTEVIKTIKQTDWSNASESDWTSIRASLSQVSTYKDEPSISMYVNALRYFSKSEDKTARNVLNYFPTDYKGEFNNEIQEFKSKYKNEPDYGLALTPISNTPRIGMTSSEVRISDWGKPDKAR